MSKGSLKLFSSDAKDLRKRILFTLFVLGIYALGTGITIVWAAPWLGSLYSELDFLGVFNLMSGGGFEKFAIFGLGVTPYINASIVTQLLTMDIIPYFKELKEQGYVGRQKINRITRYLGIILAFIQAYVLTVFLLGVNDVSMILKITLVMTAGTSFLLWLGDQITNKGIGNGQSLLIMASIVLSLPAVFTGAYNVFIGAGTYANWVGIIFFAAYLIMYLLVIVGIVWITLAERRIPIQYANKTVSAYGAKQSYLPLRINYAGVMPVIFASMLLTIPSIVVTIIGNQLSIEIDMTPARIDNEDNADETNIAIPVIIQITKTSEVNSQITCEYYEGLSNLTKVESDLEGIFYYGQLDTVEKTNNIMFKIESEEGTCSIQFDVFYGASGNKVIVSDDSNASSTFIINFIEREHLGL